MNRDDIIQHLLQAADETKTLLTNEPNWPLLMRFAALVAAHKREQCALLCDDYGNMSGGGGIGFMCAEAIRARGEEPKRHPGYIIGDHWLQAAYTRICTGETEDEVMADYGWQRESR